MASLNGYYGRGTGPILLQDVMCTGVEQQLIECPARNLDLISCRAHEIAGIECFSGMKSSTTPLIKC